MYKSFCIIQNTLYLTKASISTLIDFLEHSYTQDQIRNSDKAHVIFKGVCIDNVYKGTFLIQGDKGCRLALPYLKELNTVNSKIEFFEVSQDTYNLKITNVIYPLISDPYYEGIPFKKEII